MALFPYCGTNEDSRLNQARGIVALSPNLYQTPFPGQVSLILSGQKTDWSSDPKIPIALYILSLRAYGDRPLKRRLQNKGSLTTRQYCYLDSSIV